jgi:hypothetical protein
MKQKIIIFLIFISINRLLAVVSWSNSWVIPHSYGPSCLSKEYVEVGFYTNFEINNSQFQIQRSTDPNFNWAITGTGNFNGNFSGCGTCGQSRYNILDYGPFQPGETWYYRVKATSNSINLSYHNLGSYTTNLPTVVNWISQVAHNVTTGASPSNESAYTWAQESRDMQGVTISLMATEISKIYLEQNNNKINFAVQSSSSFLSLDVSVDGGGYNNVYSGSLVTNFIWANSISAYNTIGQHSLKVKFTAMSGTQYIREYDIYVVPRSSGFFVDNYCNTMRVWKGNNSSNPKPLVLSEGFDAYNLKPEQYYRQAGNELISCLLSKGFDVYVVNYNLNSQSIKNNGAIFQSAIRYVSSINNSEKVIATGMSMGGLINRYACAKAEHDGNPLPISKFVTIDAPHQGAVIASDFQNWRKSTLDESRTNGFPDDFAEFASNNAAAKELLNYNAYDPSGNVHNSFFSYLNSLNNDGYPHLAEKIGISFSTNNPNPNNGKWIYVNITGAPNFGGSKNYNGYLTSAETVAGSYLPKINIDGFPITVPKTFLSTALSVLRPFSNPWVTITQYLDPSFIPHVSSLDITNGISKFDKVIIPSVTGYHDIVPSELIEPIINALLEKNVFIQNKTYNNVQRRIIASSRIFVGNYVTHSIPQGDVLVKFNSSIHLKAGEEIVLANGFNIESGADFSAVVSPINCDGSSEYQSMRVVNSDNTSSDNSKTLQIDTSNSKTVYEPYNELNQSDNSHMFYKDETIHTFPNPVSKRLYLTNLLYDTEYSWNLINTQGSMVLKNKLINSNEIDISILPPGIYILHLINNSTHKINTFKVSKNE